MSSDRRLNICSIQSPDTMMAYTELLDPTEDHQDIVRRVSRGRDRRYDRCESPRHFEGDLFAVLHLE